MPLYVFYIYINIYLPNGTKAVSSNHVITIVHLVIENLTAILTRTTNPK